MEQNLVDVSKYNISIHSLDSRFSDLRNNVNSEFRIRNPTPLKNIMRVRLASAEIPLVEHIFTEEKGNDTFTVSVGGISVKSGHLLSGNYTGAGLANAVQTLLQSIHSGFTCKLSTITGFITIGNPSIAFTMHFDSSSTKVAQRPTHWGLGYYLGFRERDVTSVYVQSTGLYSAIGTSVINVQATPYYLLQLKCPDSVMNVTHRLNNDTFIEAFAKLVLKDNYYQIQFDDGSNLLRKEYTFIAPTNIPFFQVSLRDPWGDLVNMLDADWSLTLEITEIVNSKTYKDISKRYERS